MFRILIVDDDQGLRKALHLALDAHGYEVGNAAGGREALDMIAVTAPDLVLLDWHLPGMDGIRTCRELRTRSLTPVIMISGNRSNKRDVALAAGANDYLPKPFSVKELLVRIESALAAFKPLKES